MAKTTTGAGSEVRGLSAPPAPRTDTIDAKEVRAKHKEFLFPCVANYYEEPVVLTKGKGSWAWDADGREYLDFFGGILTLGSATATTKSSAACRSKSPRLATRRRYTRPPTP
jgi:4-aminobutyrate aminotransferase-like enzyme